MEQKINIAEILKYCPKGMELDCTMWDNVVFEKLDVRSSHHPIIIRRTGSNDSYYTTAHLTKYGQYSDEKDCKCVIYPKGKTTWEGFVPPIEFKDGDIVFYNDAIAIFKEWGDETLFRTYVTTYLHCDFIIDKNVPLFGKHVRKNIRFATEEEKLKLFQAIKDNGYKWNEETKTLERLPKFKVGDRVRNKNYKDYIYNIYDITDKGYRAKEINADSPILILFGPQEDNYELVPNKFDATTLVPFESKVLVRDTVKETWKPDFFGCLYDSNDCPYMVVGGIRWKYCIPYEGNEHLLGKTDDCDNFFKNW